MSTILTHAKAKKILGTKVGNIFHFKDSVKLHAVPINTWRQLGSRRSMVNYVITVDYNEIVRIKNDGKWTITARFGDFEDEQVKERIALVTRYTPAKVFLRKGVPMLYLWPKESKRATFVPESFVVTKDGSVELMSMHGRRMFVSDEFGTYQTETSNDRKLDKIIYGDDGEGVPA